MSNPATIVKRRSIAQRIASALHPRTILWAIPGPVFAKEANVLGRKASTYWVRGGYALLLLGLVSIVFLGTYLDTSQGTDAERLQRFQAIAPAITASISWFQFIMLFLCAAAMCSGAICEEQRKGSLAALMTTPLRAWQILLGKICGAFAQLLILVLIPVPLLLALRVFGGVNAEAVAATLALTFSTALLAAVLAAWHSMHVKRAAVAMLAALASLAVIQFGPALAYAILRGYGFVPPNAVWFAFFSTPIGMVGTTVDFIMGAGGTPFPTRFAVQTSSIYTLAWSAAIFIIASLQLRRLLRKQSSGDARSVAAPAAQTSTPTDAPADTPQPAQPKKKRHARAATGTSRDVSDTPVLWRETRQSAFRSRRAFYSAWLGIIGIFAFLYLKVGFDERDLYPSVSVITTILCIAAAAVATTSAINGEKEARTFDVLLSTPLSTRTIIWGKFVGALKKQWFLPLILLLHTVLGGIIPGNLALITPLHTAMILLPPMIFLTATGLLVSSIFSKSTVAAVVNFGFAVGLWALTPLFATILIELLLGGRTDEIISVLLLMNPVGMMVVATMGGHIGAFSRDYQVFDLGSTDALGFTLIAACYAGVFAIATHLTLRLAASRLAAASARTTTSAPRAA
ncbi:MAG: ABC transporter permease subunit [Planctomycetes bacterium]|nr:ABC transporter permease subunit [Planctomycetota bacterium]